MLPKPVMFEVRIGISANRPQRYTLYAYTAGLIDKQEAHDILVGKYKYGNDGAWVALEYCKQYPHKITKPADFDKIYPEGLWSDAAEQYGGR